MKKTTLFLVLFALVTIPVWAQTADTMPEPAKADTTSLPAAQAKPSAEPATPENKSLTTLPLLNEERPVVTDASFVAPDAPTPAVVWDDTSTQSGDSSVLAQPAADGEVAKTQEAYQQVIAYAIEASSAAVREAKPLGKYTCGKVFSLEGYPALKDYPCELIVHDTENGPIVVRYKNITNEMSAQIAAFIKNNQLSEAVKYANGRFRFALDKDEPEEANAQ